MDENEEIKRAFFLNFDFFMNTLDIHLQESLHFYTDEDKKQFMENTTKKPTNIRYSLSLRNIFFFQRYETTHFYKNSFINSVRLFDFFHLVYQKLIDLWKQSIIII